MANVVPETWRDRAFRANEKRASWQSDDVEVLPAHDGETISSHKAQNKLGKQAYPLLLWTSSPKKKARQVRTTCSGESRPAILPKPGNGARRDQALSLV